MKPPLEEILSENQKIRSIYESFGRLKELVNLFLENSTVFNSLYEHFTTKIDVFNGGGDFLLDRYFEYIISFLQQQHPKFYKDNEEILSKFVDQIDNKETRTVLDFVARVLRNMNNQKSAEKLAATVSRRKFFVLESPENENLSMIDFLDNNRLANERNELGRKTLGEILNLFKEGRHAELLALRNFGIGSFDMIVEKLAENGYLREVSEEEDTEG